MTRSKPARALPSRHAERSEAKETSVERAAHENSLRLGRLIRERRKALGLSQDELALATGVGRRFVIDLEAGKPTCQTGKSLVAATAV